MTPPDIQPRRIWALVVGVLLLTVAIRPDAALAGPPSLVVTSGGAVVGGVIEAPGNLGVVVPSDPALQALRNDACADADAWVTAKYGGTPAPICPLVDATVDIAGLGDQTGGLDTVGGQLEYICRLNRICPTAAPPDVQEARAAAACFNWLVFIPGHVEANPAIGIVNFETWAWMVGVLADGYENAPGEQPAPLVRDLRLQSTGVTYSPISVSLPPLRGHAGSQGLHGAAWLTNARARFNTTTVACSGDEGGNAIDHNSGGVARWNAADTILDSTAPPHLLHPNRVTRTRDEVQRDLFVLSRVIDPSGVVIRADISWDTFAWDFDGDSVAEYVIDFWDNGSGDPFTSAGATQSQIDAYAPNALSHTYTQAGRYDLTLDISFKLVSRSAWAVINETYAWYEVWPAHGSTPNSVDADSWTTIDQPDVAYCPIRHGSTCWASGNKVWEYEWWYDYCSDWETDPITMLLVRPLNCLDYTDVYRWVHYGEWEWTWNYGPRVDCRGSRATHGAPANASGELTSQDSEAGAHGPYDCEHRHEITVPTTSRIQEWYETRSTEPAFTLYGKFYKSLDSSRSDLDFQEHFGSNYRSSMRDDEVVRYPVRRFWPYLVD